jgi:hypothetical protein
MGNGRTEGKGLGLESGAQKKHLAARSRTLNLGDVARWRLWKECGSEATGDGVLKVGVNGEVWEVTVCEMDGYGRFKG